MIQKNQLVQQAQREVLLSLSRQVRARLESGKTGLSDLAQVDLSISRMGDVIAGLEEAERSARAELVRVIGAKDGTETPIAPEYDPPLALLPEADVNELKQAAIAHPRVVAMASMSEAADNAHGQRERNADPPSDLGWTRSLRATPSFPRFPIRPGCSQSG